MEVSAPIPGSFVRHDTGGPGNGLWHTMFNIGSSRRRRKRKHASHSAITPNSDSSATSFTGSSQDSLDDHPVTQHLVALRPSDGSHMSRLDQRRIPDPAVPLPLRIPAVVRSGDSLLSDTSIDEDEKDISRRDFGLNHGGVNNERSGTAYLDMPMIHEPFSIQTTPEIAYRAGSDCGSSVELVRENIGVALSRNRDSTLSTRGIGRRVSRAWKQGTASRLLEEYKRKSNQTTSSSQTARSSPLTTGIAAERPVNANAISKPTIVHISSRPGEVRQISRRVDESSPLFGGGSTVNSPRTLTPITQSASSTNSDLQKPPPALQTFTAMSRDSDTFWDGITRDSLGIAHKDLEPPAKRRSAFGNTTGQAQGDLNWSNRNSRNLMSPDQWLRPKVNSGAEGMGLPRAAPGLSLYPSVSPATQGSGTATESISIGSLDSTARTRRHVPHGDQKLHVGRTRKQQQKYDHPTAQAWHTTKPITPSPIGWPRPTAAPPQRPLPETPTRRPLAERPNGASRGGAGAPWATARGRSDMSKRSSKTLASELTNDTDDGWEDMRPDEYSSSVGGSTHGSFPALI
ncbi:hypothetical protein PG997_006104 [Apiospora hydei]|uniref:Uncharacterized protein n=1 Tax=Apiospora hydei TaxID=1337664 RepID=A0ABR1WN31_9PEZI